MPSVAMCLNAGAMGRQDAESETLIPINRCDFDVAHTLRGNGFDASEDGTGRGTPLVPVAYPPEIAGTLKSCGGKSGLPNGAEECDRMIPIAFSSKDYGNDATRDLSPTLRSMNHDASHANGGGQMAVAFDTTQITSAANYSNPKPGDACHPLAAGAHPPAIATAWQVRRLTVKECERLQGFPDGFTLIETGKRRTVEPDMGAYLADAGAIVATGNDGRVRTNAAADGPRYKALGNSWAVPCGAWILDRLSTRLKGAAA